MFPQRSSEVYRMPKTHQPPPAMELAENYDYPNLNVADLNARLENLSPRLHDCWDSLAINEEKHIALATNRREGRHWWGMFFGFARSKVNHMSVGNADYKLQAEHTINIVRYAENNVLLVALGDTRLQAWSTYSKVRNPNQPYCLFLVGEAAVHPSPISQLSVFKSNQQKAVSASSDGTLNVWDLSSADLSSCFHTRSSHLDKLTGLTTRSASAEQFVTCDRGGCVRLWDIRTAAPSSSCLFDDDSHLLSFTCGAWAGPTELQGDNNVYLGDFDGKVHTVDIRVPRKLAETTEYFDKGYVSQLLINGPHLAAMSNLPAAVKVSNVNSGHKVIYKHKDTHSRLTDAIWTDEKTLLTIGHGRKLVTHSLK